MTDAPQTTSTRARTKSEAYDVYRRDADGTLDLLMENVKVSSRGDEARRQEAVVKATAELEEDQQYGGFATVKHGELQSHTRGRKVEPTDVWT